MMTKKMMWKSILLLLLGTAMVTSCVEDPEPAPLDAIPDVFIQKIVQDDVEMYGISFWVLANKDLDSVLVSGPDNGEWKLEAEESNNRVYKLSPELNDYSDTIPPSGDYNFKISSTQKDETPRNIIDKLEEKELAAVYIDTTFFDNGKLNIEWIHVESADGYFIRLYDDADKMIFMSQEIDNEDTEYSFGLSDSGWIDPDKKATNGEEYKLEVVAILYESDATSGNKNYNVQFVSIASTEKTWGN